MSIKRSSDPSWADVVSLFQQSIGSKFIIPVYQRNYVWDAKKQVKTLLDDFYSLIGNDKTHFLGIIIDYLASGSARSHKYYVIDGQQRLTTLFLLIRALKQRAIEEKDEELKAQLDLCLDVYPGKKDYKLEPLMSDGNVFKKILDGEFQKLSDSDKNSKVAQAYIYIYNFVTNTVNNIDLASLIDALSRLYVVEIPLDKEDNAQQIFESINAKGSALLATDLIRNYILMCTEDDKKDSVFINNWRPFEDRFADSSELEKFFRFFVMNQFKEFVKKNDVYDSFRNWVDEQKKVSSIEDIISHVDKYASCYEMLYKKDLAYIKNEKLWKVLKDYRNIESEMPAPLMLEMVALMGEEDITEEQFIEVTTVINSFILRRAIIGMDTSGISRFFTTVIKSILVLCDDTYSNIVDVVKYCIVDDNKNKASRMPDDSEVSQKLKKMNVYDNSLALHCFFDKYENEKITNPVQTMNYQIEHIMPQDGTKWLSIVGLSKDEYNDQVNRLGNLTLTTKHDNPAMSNNLFDYKQIILKDTAHFRLNVDVYSNPTWNINAIDLRNESLIKDVIRLYPYEESVDKAIYDELVAKSKSLPRMDKLIEWGIISKGDEVCLSRYKDSSKAILLDADNVSFNGETLKITQWITKIYGFKSGINSYREMYLVGGVDSLDALRNAYIKDHATDINDDIEDATCRNVLAIKLKSKLNEFEKKGLIVNFDSKNHYIRFVSSIIRNKVGLKGDGTWSKIQDLIVYEIQNTVDSGANICLYIGPGKQDLRQKWLNFSINSKILSPRYLKLKDKWNQILNISLVDARDRYSTDEEYFIEALNNLDKFFITDFIEIDKEFENVSSDLEAEAFTVSGDIGKFKVYDEAYHLAGIQKAVLDAYNEIKSSVARIANFDIIPTKVYLAFKFNGNNVFDIEVFKSKLRVSLNAKLGTISDPESKCRDITNIGTHGNGDYDININSIEDVPYLLELIKQALEQNK